MSNNPDKDENAIQPKDPSSLSFGDAKDVMDLRAAAVCNALRIAIRDNSAGVSPATLLGCMEVVRTELMMAVGIIPTHQPQVTQIPAEYMAMVEKAARDGKLDG